MPAARARVLVVDDDPSFAKMVSEVLRDRGYDAVAAGDPVEALGLAGRAEFAAAVVDLVMPGLSGLELTDRLRALCPDTEVVVLTGHADVPSAVGGIRAGIFDYLQKPSLDLDRLVRTVASAALKSELTRENRSLVERLAESTRLLRVKSDASAHLYGESQVDRLLDVLVESARTLTGAEAGRALLLERRPLGDFVVRKAAGKGTGLEGSRFAAEGGLAMLAAHKGTPVRTDDPASHPSYSARCDEMPTHLPGLLCCPLSRRGVLGVLMVAGRDRPFGEEDESMLMSLARQGAVALENADGDELNLNFFAHASEMLVSLLDRQDVHFAGHARRVMALADMVSRRLGLSDEGRWAVHYGALLHDVGKLTLGPEILATREALGEKGRGLMREHPTRGLDLLKPITKWEGVLPIVHAHHERWDGTGYPRGLTGEAIPQGARIVAVAEAFDVITRDTPQGRRRSAEEALAELSACAGTQFDPRIVLRFVSEYREQERQLGP